MKFVGEKDRKRLRSLAGSCGQALKRSLLHLWDVYSAPTPVGKDILTQLALCLTLAVVTGGLLHRWLSWSLKYHHEASVQTACISSAALFLVSFLCHPLRCVLTMTLPTVCTKQGRKLLISASVMILMLNVVPNVALNIGAIPRILKCTAEGFTEALSDSSRPVNAAKQDLTKATLHIRWEDLRIVTNLRKLDDVTRVDTSPVRGRFMRLIGLMEEDFTHAENLLKEYKLLSNRIVAGLFVALLILEAARYLKSYLTCVQFDNRRPSSASRRAASHAGHSTTDEGGVTCAARFKLTSRECTYSFVSLALVTLYFAPMTLIVALDHVVYRAVEVVSPLFLDFPPMFASISVGYKVRWAPPALCIIPGACVTKELANFNGAYGWTFDLEPHLCDVTTSAPDRWVALLLGCLWLMSYLLVFLEVYAKRLRRRISASFFREQEERRAAYRTERRQAELNQREIPSVAGLVGRG